MSVRRQRGRSWVGRSWERVSFIPRFSVRLLWFGGGNRLERERREFEPVPVSSAAGRLREQTGEEGQRPMD